MFTLRSYRYQSYVQKCCIILTVWTIIRLITLSLIKQREKSKNNKNWRLKNENLSKSSQKRRSFTLKMNSKEVSKINNLLECPVLSSIAFNQCIIIDFLKFFQPGHFQTVWVSKGGKEKRSIWYANLKSRALSKKCSILKWVSEDKEKETIKWIYACVIRRHLTSLWVVRQLEYVQHLKFRWVILYLSIH